MPLYEFHCDKCDNSDEMVMPISRMEKFKKHGVPCDKCKDGTMRPAMGAPAFVDRANLRIPMKRKRLI